MSTTDTAAAAGSWSLWVRLKIHDEATSVLKGRLPEMRTTEPYSPRARAKAMPGPGQEGRGHGGQHHPAEDEGRRAPSEAAASSVSVSSSASTGCTERTQKGSVTKARASRMPIRVPATFTPNGLSGPYKASRVRPATTVGRAKGRSTRAPTSRLPTKSSRTSTQAMINPATEFTAATPRAEKKVSFKAATDSGSLTAVQKAPRPPLSAVEQTAATGRRTRSDR